MDNGILIIFISFLSGMIVRRILCERGRSRG